MELDIIGYRYSTDELSVLMSMQGKERVPAIPGIYKPDREQFMHGMDLLEENDIMAEVKGQLLLDRIHGFLISNLCDCDRYLSISKEKDFLALCVCPQIQMTVQTRDRERWVIRVASEFEGIQEEFIREAKRFQSECMIRMADEGEEESRMLPDWKTLEKKLREAIMALKKRKGLFD